MRMESQSEAMIKKILFHGRLTYNIIPNFDMQHKSLIIWINSFELSVNMIIIMLHNDDAYVDINR